MKKIFNIIFIGIGLAATSCSELPEYELPYELSPTTDGSVSVSSSPSNSLCPGPAATFTVESEGSILYVVQPAEDEAPTSKEIWENDDAGEVTFAEAGSQVIDLDFDEMWEGLGGWVLRDSMRYNVTETQRNGMFPIQMGVRLEMISHPAIKIADYDVEMLIDKVEETIASKIHQ